MKKSFLLCLMALFGVLGMYAAPASGDGTEANPYIVADGDTYPVGEFQKVYIQFTTTSASTLTLTTVVESDFFPQLSYNITCDGVTNTFNTGFGNPTATYQLEAGKTYTVWNNSQYAAVDVKVGIEVLEDAITATATPADGSSMEELVSTLQAEVEGEPYRKTTYPITVKLSKAVGFVAATFADSKNDFRTTVRGHNYDIAVEYQRVTSTGGSMGDSQGDVTGETVPEFYLGEQTSDTWMIGPEVAADRGENSNSWTLYDDRTYSLTLEFYDSQLDWEQGGAPIGLATITYNGSTPAIQYSTIKLIDIYPNPDLANPEDDHMMLNIADGRDQAVLIFDGYIKRVEAGIAGGQGMGESPCDVQYIYNSDSQGNVKSTAVLLTIPSGTTISALTNVRAWDNNDRALWDEDPAYGSFSTAVNQYTFDFPVADGRVADASLNYSSVDPSTENVTSLEKVTFGFNQQAQPCTDAHEKIGLYNAEGEKVADVAIANAMGSSETKPSQIVLTFIEPGTLQITEEVYDNQGNLVTPYSETGTPVQLENGTYELRIAQQAFKNGYFSEETPWIDGQQGHGVCNPEWTFTYNLVTSIPEVSSINPTPYDGETYNTELPAEVTVTFSEPVTINSASVSVGTESRYAISEENITIDGNNVTFVVPAEALTGVTYSLIISAVNAEGAAVTYGEDAEEGQTLITYQVNPAVMEATFDPASGSTVTSLHDILMTVDETLGLALNGGTVSVKDATGAEVATGYIDYFSSEGVEIPMEILNQAYIVLNNAVTEAGTYTVEIPAGAVTSGDQSVELMPYTLTYTVDPTVGVENVAAEAVESIVNVYNLDGALVATGKVNEVKKNLAKGVYVVNDRKFVVR